jgi:hypothetical protein
MRSSKILLATAAIAMLASSQVAYAKKKPTMTSLQIQEMQTKDLETDKGTAFSAVMTVLQDSGYRIGNADKETGLITGVASTNTKTTWLPFVGFGKSKKTPVVSAFVEDLSPSVTKVRLNFVMTKVSANGFGGGEDEEPILDPAIYQDAFEKIDQAVFVRQSMRAAAPKAVEPTPAPVEPAAAAAPAPSAQ